EVCCSPVVVRLGVSCGDRPFGNIQGGQAVSSGVCREHFNLVFGNQGLHVFPPFLVPCFL
ncbi:MAG: hypothetical protein LBT87_07460, partial [Treponema sp.]|nr:hypothetical protein [Treponema sp.]